MAGRGTLAIKLKNDSGVELTVVSVGVEDGRVVEPR